MDQQTYGKEFLGSGFAFPVEPDAVTGRIRTVSQEDAIRQSIYIILRTRKGERVMRPEFGCGIYDFAFETMDYATLSQIGREVKEALILWEPRIRDIEVEAEPDPAEDGKLLIQIRYVVRSTNNPYNLVYPFFMNEGEKL